MNLELFIAKRLVSGEKSKGNVSRRLVAITTFGISLGLTVMLISVAIVTGFKKQITQKIIGFGGHIQIEYLDNNSTFETKPISSNQPFLPDLKKMKGIVNIQPFATKHGIMKTKDEFQGVVLKGIDSNFDWSFFKKYLTKGRIPRISDTITNEILISQSLADILHLKVESDVALIFIQEPNKPAKLRRMHIVGFYQTGLSEMDKDFILGDIKQVQQLYNWNSDQISGFEIIVQNFKDVEYNRNNIHQLVGLSIQPDGSALRTSSILDKYPQLFDWLNLQNLNVIVILVIMLFVASFNMIGGLLILILERTKMIGLLMSMGAPNISIRKIFLYQSGFLILRGLFWGNLIGLIILYFQDKFKLIKLNEATYFISSVPVNFNITHILLLNAGTLVIVILMLLGPSLIISRISPEITLKYN